MPVNIIYNDKIEVIRHNDDPLTLIMQDVPGLESESYSDSSIDCFDNKKAPKRILTHKSAAKDLLLGCPGGGNFHGAVLL